MTRAELNTWCSGLTAATHHLRWGDHDVWKVGDKMFLIIGEDAGRLTCSFKCSDISFEILREQPGLRPAPYLASRGQPWIQQFEDPGLDDEALRDYIAESHRIIGTTLSKKKQRELGLLTD